MLDFLGQSIVTGDRVVWPAQAGHRLSMRVGRVKRINDRSCSLFIMDDNGDGCTVHRIDNVVVVK